MAALNKVMLIGNVGGEPEVRFTNNNNQVCNFSLATADGPANQDGQRETQWHKIVAFGKLAEIVEKYVRKGMSLYVEGRIVYRKYVSPTNETKYFTEIIASQMQILTRKNDNSYQSGSQGIQQNQPASRPASNDNVVSNAPESFDVSGIDPVTDEDMPF